LVGGSNPSWDAILFGLEFHLVFIAPFGAFVMFSGGFPSLAKGDSYDIMKQLHMYGTLVGSTVSNRAGQEGNIADEG